MGGHALMTTMEVYATQEGLSTLNLNVIAQGSDKTLLGWRFGLVCPTRGDSRGFETLEQKMVKFFVDASFLRLKMVLWCFSP